MADRESCIASGTWDFANDRPFQRKVICDHEFEFVDDSFDDGFYKYSGGHLQCILCGEGKQSEYLI